MIAISAKNDSPCHFASARSRKIPAIPDSSVHQNTGLKNNKCLDIDLSVTQDLLCKISSFNVTVEAHLHGSRLAEDLNERNEAKKMSFTETPNEEISDLTIDGNHEQSSGEDIDGSEANKLHAPVLCKNPGRQTTKT